MIDLDDLPLTGEERDKLAQLARDNGMSVEDYCSFLLTSRLKRVLAWYDPGAEHRRRRRGGWRRD